MDFLKILRSFEEFILQAMTWLLFYPLTLLRIVARPLTAMSYSDVEQNDREEGRYDDAVSPPLLLLITLVLMNALSIALHVPQPHNTSSAMKAIEASPQNLILFRSLVFSLLPLVAAVTLLVAQKQRLSRSNLRPPFYAQCYLVAPLALAVSVGGQIFQRNDIENGWGLAAMAAAGIWFVVSEVRWFAAKLEVGRARATGLTVIVLLGALLYFLLIVIPLALL